MSLYIGLKYDTIDHRNVGLSAQGVAIVTIIRSSCWVSETWSV